MNSQQEERIDCYQKLCYLLKARKNNLIKEEEEKIKNSKVEIEQIRNSVVIKVRGKALYITRYEYGFKIESIPFNEEETFEISCARDKTEFLLYNTLLDFMKELFGTKVLLNPVSDISFDFENKKITLASDSKPSEYCDLIYDDENRKITIKLRTKKEARKLNNRMAFDYDCTLAGGSYPCFDHFMQRLLQIANLNEPKESLSR